jgi:hypothetical protein
MKKYSFKEAKNPPVEPEVSEGKSPLSEARVDPKVIQSLVDRLNISKSGHTLSFSLGSATYGRAATIHWTDDKTGGEADIYRASSPRELEVFIRGMLAYQNKQF